MDEECKIDIKDIGEKNDDSFLSDDLYFSDKVETCLMIIDVWILFVVKRSLFDFNPEYWTCIARESGVC